MKPEDLDVARDEIFRLLTFIDIDEISTAVRAEAYEVCRDVDLKDTPFVALSIHLRALLWTNDKELRKGASSKGFNKFYDPVMTTQMMFDYLKEAGSITGQSFVRDLRLGPEREMVIVFFHDFEDYRRERPTSRLTPEMFANYFSSGDRILKSLLLDSVRILRNLPTLRSIEIVLPFEGEVYSVKITRAEAEEYFNIDLLELAYDPAKWVEFTSASGYDKGNRRAFFERFGRREES